MKFIQKLNMASETVHSFMRSGILVTGGTPAEIDGGAILKFKGLAENSVYAAYSTGFKDFNKYEMQLVTADDVTADGLTLYVADPVNVSHGEIMDVDYRMGSKTLGITVPANEPCALRKLVTDDLFYLSGDNFAAAPAIGEFAILTAAASTLTPAAAAPATGAYFEILDSKPMIQGLDVSGTGFLVRVARI